VPSFVWSDASVNLGAGRASARCLAC